MYQSMAPADILSRSNPYFTDEDKAKWDEASYTAGVWEDTMYAAPENTSCQELYYNKTLLEEAGIELPENDAEHRLTYEQVADMAKQAQASTGIRMEAKGLSDWISSR